MLEGKSDYPTIFEVLLRSMNTYRHLNTNATRQEVAQHLVEYLILLYNEHTIGANGFLCMAGELYEVIEHLGAEGVK